jgi:peroxiredoxin
VIEVPTQLQFSATTVASGAAFEGADLAGKNTVLWFWAPWCPVCQAESGTVLEALAELPQGVTLIGVAGQSDVASMQAFLDKYGVDTFEHVADVDGAVWSGFGITYQPAYAFIGEDGSVRTVPSVMSKADIVAGANALVN